MTDPDRLSEDYKQWLIWHHGSDTQYGALHRDTGLTITADTPAALAEALTAIQSILDRSAAPTAGDSSNGTFHLSDRSGRP